MGPGRGDTTPHPGRQPATPVQVLSALTLEPACAYTHRKPWRSPMLKTSHCGGLGSLWIVLALAALPASAGEVRVYATNSAGDNIHVIDPATNKVVQVIGGIETPHGVDFRSGRHPGFRGQVADC